MISFSQYTSEDHEQVTEFHRKSYGRHRYQANLNYLTWLYDENPNSSSVQKGWIARAENDAIVGCVHAMHLFTTDKQTTIISLQNLIVDEAYRGGVGVLLVKRALKNADIVILPGVAADTAETYRKIRWEVVPTFWGRKPLRPLSVLYGLGLAKLGVHRKTSEKLLAYCENNQPTETQISDLANRLSTRQGNQIYWTPEMVTWRFFSDKGPKHMLFMDQSNQDAFCVVSLGMRRNVCVVRLIEYGSNVEFLQSTLTTLRTLGAELCLVFGASSVACNTLRELDIPELKGGATSFVKRHPRCKLRDDFGLSAGLTDLGFEGIGPAK